MSDITATIGLPQLSLLDEQNAVRAELVSAYRERLSEIPGVELPLHLEMATDHVDYIAVVIRRGWSGVTPRRLAA